MSFKHKYNEFEKIDVLSNISMLDYYQKNYKKNRLFKSRSYPTSIFFYELTNRIILKLNLPINKHFVDYHFAENTTEPIPDYWYKFCGFEFENIFYVAGHYEVAEYEWYYIMLLSNKPNIKNKHQNIKYLNKIRKLSE